VPKLRLDQYLCVLLITAAIVFSQTGSPLVLPATVELHQSVELVSAAKIPVFTSEDGLSFQDAQSRLVSTLSGQAIYAVDVPSASVLVTKNAEESRYPASTTKLMTALVARETYPLDTFMTVRNEATTAGSVVGLVPGERLPIRDLLSAMLIQSGNDAAQVLADNYPGGESGFLKAMNTKAAQLQLTNSQFTNATGIDTDGHRSTARDLAILAKEVMEDPLLAEIVGTRSETIADDLRLNVHTLTNTNALLSSELGVIGIKTGTTEAAGEVLITEFRHQGLDILIVIMGSEDRYNDTRAVLNWIQDHYIWTDPYSGTLNTTSN